MNEDFVLRLKYLMNLNDLNQSKLSKKTGIKESDISRYLNTRQVPRSYNLVLIAKALDTTPNYLLGFSENLHAYDDEKELYVVLSSGCIGYIENICTCKNCKERREIEIFINGLDDRYLECIKHHELFDKSKVLNVGQSINDLSKEPNDAKIARFFADLYQSELLKTKGSD